MLRGFKRNLKTSGLNVVKVKSWGGKYKKLKVCKGKKKKKSGPVRLPCNHPSKGQDQTR